MKRGKILIKLKSAGKWMTKEAVIIIRSFGFVFLAIFTVAIIAFYLVPYDQMTKMLVISGLALIIFSVFFTWAYYLKVGRWNRLTITEKAKIFASELFSGKRGWYLNQIPNKIKFIFAPLKQENLKEFGKGTHIKSTKITVIKLLEEERIDNDVLTWEIVNEFNKL